MSEAASPLPAEVLIVEGADAGHFMHGQFTSHVLSLPEGRWQFSAWLDAQGRVRFLFHLARLGEQRWALLLRGGSAEALKQELARYVFRAKLTMQARTFAHLQDAPALDLHEAKEIDGALHIGCGDYTMQTSSDHDAPSDTWRAKQIENGWPWLPAGTTGQYVAASLALQRLGAIVLDKGCYPGQEIVARMHYRGGNKRHLCRVTLSHGIEPGTSLYRTGDATAPMQLLDVVQEDSSISALAVVHESWTIDANTSASFECVEGVVVELRDVWIEKTAAAVQQT